MSRDPHSPSRICGLVLRLNYLVLVTENCVGNCESDLWGDSGTPTITCPHPPRLPLSHDAMQRLGTIQEDAEKGEVSRRVYFNDPNKNRERVEKMKLSKVGATGVLICGHSKWHKIERIGISHVTPSLH